MFVGALFLCDHFAKILLMAQLVVECPVLHSALLVDTIKMRPTGPTVAILFCFELL